LTGIKDDRRLDRHDEQPREGKQDPPVASRWISLRHQRLIPGEVRLLFGGIEMIEIRPKSGRSEPFDDRGGPGQRMVVDRPPYVDEGGL